MNENKTPLVGLLAGAQTDVVYAPKTITPGDERSQERTARRMTDPNVVAAAEAYFDSPERLHGDSMPSATIAQERPVHRLMIWLHAMGKTAKEIAEQTGYSYQSVNIVLRQPWARQRLTTILQEAGIDEVQHFLKSEVTPSLHVLREIRDNAQAKPADRRAAADSILDRALGKPTVHVEANNTTRNVPADLQRLEAEIAATQKQLADLGHGPAN